LDQINALKNRKKNPVLRSIKGKKEEGKNALQIIADWQRGVPRRRLVREKRETRKSRGECIDLDPARKGEKKRGSNQNSMLRKRIGSEKKKRNRFI